jgi:hypothetical protein
MDHGPPSFENPLPRETQAVMSARQYHARADALVSLSETAADYDLILELKANAENRRKLADQRNALKSALEATRG